MRMFLALVAVIGCKHETSSALDRTDDYPVPAAKPTPAPVAVAPAPTPDPAPPAADGVEGKITTTMDAGGYTYAELEKDGKKVWVAGPQTKLAVGMVLPKMSGQLMQGFRSNTLNRTFDAIYFVATFPGATAAVATPTPTTGTDEKVAPAPGGKTVAGIWAAKDALKGKQVSVRGKVVKLNNGIMGKNWIHLHDGTGEGTTADILVTTQDVVKLGDTVTATGAIATKQDFGAGYAYEVMVENASVK